MDPAQTEALQAFDQTMFRWVNQNQLPLAGVKLQVLKLFSEVFGGKLCTTGEVVWTPDMKAKKLTRVLITGKAVVGAEVAAAAPAKEDDNEFDVDLTGGCGGGE